MKRKMKFILFASSLVLVFSIVFLKVQFIDASEKPVIRIEEITPAEFAKYDLTDWTCDEGGYTESVTPTPMPK